MRLARRCQHARSRPGLAGAAVSLGVDIWCVDDDPAIRNLAATVLHHKLGAHVEGFEDGSSALERARTGERPSVILLDAMMPGLDGFSVCAALRQLPQLREVPIVFLSAVGADEQGKAIAAGANDIVHKPFTVHGLVDRLRRWLPSSFGES